MGEATSTADNPYMALFSSQGMSCGVFRSDLGISLSFSQGGASSSMRLDTPDARRYAALIVAQCDVQDAAKRGAV